MKVKASPWVLVPAGKTVWFSKCARPGSVSYKQLWGAAGQRVTAKTGRGGGKTPALHIGTLHPDTRTTHPNPHTRT